MEYNKEFKIEDFKKEIVKYSNDKLLKNLIFMVTSGNTDNEYFKEMFNLCKNRLS